MCKNEHKVTLRIMLHECTQRHMYKTLIDLTTLLNSHRCFKEICRMAIDFFNKFRHKPLTSHSQGGSGITETLHSKGRKTLWPLASSTFCNRKRVRPGYIPIMDPLESSCKYRKGVTMKIKPCSVLCAQVFCLLGDIRISNENVGKSREQIANVL